jgi:hypothetical protein
MPCVSGNQAEFRAEMNIHFPGLKNVDRLGVLVFPKILVCLDCGFTQFKLPETDLRLLTESAIVEMPAFTSCFDSEQ